MGICLSNETVDRAKKFKSSDPFLNTRVTVLTLGTTGDLQLRFPRLEVAPAIPSHVDLSPRFHLFRPILETDGGCDLADASVDRT